MVSRLRHLGLAPDSDEPRMSYMIRGERYTAELGPGGDDDVQLIHHDRNAPMNEAGPSQARPSSPAAAAPPELGHLIDQNGRRVFDTWVFIPQTASGAQINMLRNAGCLPTEGSPTMFSIYGVPHRAEWRDVNHIHIQPELASSSWPGYTSEGPPAE
ncbi:hypothetical protein AXW67_20005 [Bradyrhizobium neotropicale]|uniref:Uncharacterized protein n=1 Tax=Bradyrhizobium neotropicale TaxID=1497615 RepID=A0A176YXP3_9BRAD|nr:hypothetical protein AXW67_20005 [Bradyrhizobium neotropicale]